MTTPDAPTLLRVDITCPDGVTVTYRDQTVRQAQGLLDVWPTEPGYKLTIQPEE